jgi:L-alanine-DL-glutamate epimerase-like enolase superfamily enzyme
MEMTKDPEKKIDLPPTGRRNADPITDAPGSHPIETGIGAAVAGAASGMAVGMVAGPVGTVVGAAIGAVAGGYAGKGIGEMIDPTTEDNWLRDNFESRPYYQPGDTFETYEPVYRYGAEAESKYGDVGFDEIVDELESDWAKSAGYPGMKWPQARPAVKDAYDRTVQIRRERSAADMEDTVDYCEPEA